MGLQHSVGRGLPEQPARRGPPGWLMAAAGCAAIALVVAGDLLTPERAVLLGLTVLGPLVASLAATWRQTAAVAVLGFATALLLGLANGIFFTLDHLIRLAGVGLIGALAIYAAAQRGQRQLAMERLTHVSEMAQTVMLRPPPAVLAHVGLAGRYVSASDEALVGGDLYETAYTPYGVRVVIGDVRGKGLDGIRLAAVVLATFRESLWDRDLLDLARTLDKRVSLEAETDEDFVTALVVEFPHEGGVSVVNCGHHPPLRVREHELEELGPADPTLPLGLNPEPRVEHFAFAVGERLLLCTDGLLEGRGARGAFFPVGEQVDALRLPDLQAATGALVDRFVAHTGGRFDDDLAVLLAERRS